MIVGPDDPFWHDDWLAAEMVRAAAALPFAVLAQLDAMGVPQAMLAHMAMVGDLGRMRVVERGGSNGSRYFEPAEEGQAGPPRLIVAVRDAVGALVDLAAVSSVDPDTWSLRTGEGFVLGFDVLAQAEAAALAAAFRRDNRLAADAEIDAACTVRLFARPIDLLIAGGDGVCVLDWRPAALWALRSLGPGVTLVADDAASAARLADLLRCGGLPAVKFQRGRGRMAA